MIVNPRVHGGRALFGVAWLWVLGPGLSDLQKRRAISELLSHSVFRDVAEYGKSEMLRPIATKTTKLMYRLAESGASKPRNRPCEVKECPMPGVFLLGAVVSFIRQIAPGD